MGYTTDFEGQFDLDKPLEENHRLYLRQFAETRRMRRNSAVAETLPDPLRIAVGLSIGHEGEFFVGATGNAGQDRDSSITNYNEPPSGQPSLWCQWVPNKRGDAIVWDEGEKFYEYVEWLNYLIDTFLDPWGYTLDGEVEYQGEENDDFGKIVVRDNVVKVLLGKRTYEEEDEE